MGLGAIVALGTSGLAQGTPSVLWCCPHHESLENFSKLACVGTSAPESCVECRSRLASATRRRSTPVAAAEKLKWRDGHQTGRQVANGPEVPLADRRSGNSGDHWQRGFGRQNRRIANQLWRWRGSMDRRSSPNPL